jgi:hypothetical protein
VPDLKVSSMTRTSKQGRLRRISKRRPAPPSLKTGPKKNNLPLGFKPHENAILTEETAQRFFPKIPNIRA